MIEREKLLKVLDEHAGSALTRVALQALADEILKLDAPTPNPVTDTGTIFPEIKAAVRPPAARCASTASPSADTARTAGRSPEFCC